MPTVSKLPQRPQALGLVQVGFQLEILYHRRNGRFGVQVLQSGKKGQVLPAAEAAVKTRFIAGNETQMAFGARGPGQGIAALDEDAAFGGGKQGGDELYQGGLAGGVGAGDTEALPGKKLKGRFRFAFRLIL